MLVCDRSVNSFQVALFTVNYFGARRLVCRFDHSFAVIALSLPQLSWISECHSLSVTFIGMEVGNGEALIAVEVEFLLDDAEGTASCFAADGPAEDIFRYILDQLR